MGNRKDHLSAFDYDVPDPAEFTAEAPAPEPEPKAIPKDRFDEVNERLRSAETQRDELIRQLASGMVGQSRQKQGAGDDGDDGEDPLSDMDPSVSAALQALVGREVSKIRSDLVSQFGPALEAAARNESIEQLDARVPGFKDQLMADVEKEYNSLPADEREAYNSRVGLEALANRVRARKLEEQMNRGGSGRGMGSMGSIPSQSPSHEAVPSGGRGDVDPWSLSDEDFEKYKRRVAR